MATKTTHLGLSKAELTDAVRSTLIANNDNFDKIDEVYAEVNETIDEKEQALQGQIDRLRANQIQGSASGTEVVVQDSAEMESVLQLSGNSEQDSRSGKNKLNLTKGTYSNGGISVTVTEEKVTVNGTSTGASIYIPLVTPVIVNSSTTYTKSLNPTGTYTGVKTSLRLQDKNNAGLWTNNCETSSGVITAGDIYYFLIQVDSSISVDCTLKVQLEEGTVATSYEPYGVQPSPDYPAEIRSVKSKSDNLFDGIFELGIINGTNGTLQDNSNNIRSKNYIPVDSNSDYTFYSPTWAEYYYIYEYDENYNYVLSTNKSTKNTFKTDSTTKYIKFRFSSAITDLTTKVMLNKGDKALPYQPYGYVPAEAKAEGKNLAKNVYSSSNIIVSDGLCTQSDADTRADMQWKAEGRLEGTKIKQFALFIDNALGVKKVGFTKDDSFNRIYLGLNGSTKDTLVYIPVGHLINGKYYVLQWNVLNATQGSVSWNNIQIERNDKATEYVPYVEPKTISIPLGDIKLRSTPDGTRDTFARVDGKWNKVEKIGNVVLNGSERGWTKNTEGNVTNYYNNSLISFEKRSGYCSHFIVSTDTSMANEITRLCLFSTGKGFGIFAKTSIFGTLEELLTWLSTHNIEFIYPLTTPTYTPITDQALISALDELEQLILHKGYNYITATSVNGVKAQLDLSYIKDINAVLDNLTAAILTLGGELNV